MGSLGGKEGHTGTAHLKLLTQEGTPDLQDENTPSKYYSLVIFYGCLLTPRNTPRQGTQCVAWLIALQRENTLPFPVGPPNTFLQQLKLALSSSKML